jgi:putative ABC transport system permease protein
MLAKSPGFAAVAILTLGLGIGANTAIFSVVDAVMLRPYPYADMDRIMILREITRDGTMLSVSWPNFKDWREQNQVFEGFGVYRAMTANLTGGDQPERLVGSLVSADVFKAAGIGARLGRTFAPQEDLPGAPRIAVISERLWTSHFDSDPSIVGRPIVKTVVTAISALAAVASSPGILSACRTTPSDCAPCTAHRRCWCCPTPGMLRARG